MGGYFLPPKDIDCESAEKSLYDPNMTTHRSIFCYTVFVVLVQGRGRFYTWAVRSTKRAMLRPLGSKGSMYDAGRSFLYEALQELTHTGGVAALICKHGH